MMMPARDRSNVGNKHWRDWVWLAAIITVVTAATIVGIRAAIGPLQLGPVGVRSPLPLEEAFAIALLLVAFTRDVSPADAHSSAQPRWLHLAACLILVALLLAWNLRDPFLSDDYILVSRATLDRHAIAAYFTTAGGDGSFRPIGYVYRAVAAQWAQFKPWRWHVCGLLLHLMNCALLYLLTWMLWSNAAISFASAALFGMHGSRPEVVTWTAGSFDSLACLFSLAAVLCAFYARGRRWWAGWIALEAILIVLAIGSKESAYATPFLLLGFAWATATLPDPVVKRSFICAVAVCAVLFIYRWILFAGPGGYANPVTGQPAILSLNLLSSAKALLLRIWAILLFPLNWDAGDGWPLAISIAVSAVAVLWIVIGAGSVSRKICAAMLATTACAVLPAIHLALIGEAELGSRILYLPSAAFCILLAHLAASAGSRARQLTVLGAICLGFALVLIHNLAAWHKTALEADRFCSAVASARVAGAPPPSVEHGVFFFANGLPDCVAMKRHTCANCSSVGSAQQNQGSSR